MCNCREDNSCREHKSRWLVPVARMSQFSGRQVPDERNLCPSPSHCEWYFALRRLTGADGGTYTDRDTFVSRVGSSVQKGWFCYVGWLRQSTRSSGLYVLVVRRLRGMAEKLSAHEKHVF